MSLADSTIGSTGSVKNSTITIAVKEPEVEHTVRIKDFETLARFEWKVSC
jgi:hypothetical protein